MAISALAAYLILWSDAFADKSPTSQVRCQAAALQPACERAKYLHLLEDHNLLQPWKDAPLKRHTQVSSAALGLSVGYFVLDITLIIRHFPWVRSYLPCLLTLLCL